MFFFLTEFTQLDIISQIFEFFEATITENNVIINYIAHILADNSAIQSRVRAEMLQINASLTNEILTYEAIPEMKYMDTVISEAARLCPITPQLRRRATKPYTLENSNGAKIVIQPGESIWIPSYVMQTDPQYYPNPLKFDPDRFSDANKGDIRTGTYAPFGMGPRDCIGCRYTVLEVKVTFFYLMLHFELTRADAKETVGKSIRIKKIHA